MPFSKLKKFFLDEEDEGLPKNDVPVVSIEEEETIKDLLKPRRKKLVKINIKGTSDIQPIIPYVQSNDIIIIDLSRLLSKPDELQKIAHKIEGIATAANAKVMRISGCKAHLMIIPEDIEIIKL